MTLPARSNPGQRAHKGDSGFTLVELIFSLVVVGILASIAGMGVVSAISGYAIVRENVSLSQKIQLAATRIQRELLELTAIGFKEDSRPCLIYESATGAASGHRQSGTTRSGCMTSMTTSPAPLTTPTSTITATFSPTAWIPLP